MNFRLFCFFCFFFLAASCNKNQSYTPPAYSGLIKTITSLSDSSIDNSNSHIDSFVYDVQNRVSKVIATLYSLPTLRTVITYDFTYTGNQQIPSGYYMSYDTLYPWAFDNYAGSHYIKSNLENEIILDSILLGSNQNGINRYMTYSSNLISRTWGRYGSDSQFYMIQSDSIITLNGNITQVIIGQISPFGSGTQHYEWLWTYHYTYDQVINPLFNTQASVVCFLLPNYLSTKYCPSTSQLVTHDSVYSARYQNHVDEKGTLKRITTYGTPAIVRYTYY